jgi:hypothetical protein
MPWATITAADVEAHLNAGELADYRKHAAEIADPLPIVIADVVALVRAFIGAKYSLTQAGIPGGLRIPAIDLVIHQLAKRIRKSGDDDAARNAAAERAMEMLNRVSAGTMSLGELSEEGDFMRAGNYGSSPRFGSPPE